MNFGEDEVGSSETDGDTGGESTETGEPAVDGCAPGDVPSGFAHACLGTGNGWLNLNIQGKGNEPPQCVNWGPEGKPENPTIADCVPVDLTMLPSDVPSPEACCTVDALAPVVIEQCNDDCGYAACKLAIAKLREAADALPEPNVDPITEGAQERASDDLYGFANTLEMPDFLAACADMVSDGAGTPVVIDLGEGGSPVLPGHINHALLTLQCNLDGIEPYLLETPEAVCDSTPNIPFIDDQSNLGGAPEQGAITMFGSSGTQSTALSNIVIEFDELHMRDGSTVLTLSKLDADVQDASLGNFTVLAPHIQLAAPIRATMLGNAAIFPAGTLRIAASGVVLSGGEPLFEGERMSEVYVNTQDASVVRGADGSVAIVDATFEAGPYTFVLNTEPAPTQPRE